MFDKILSASQMFQKFSIHNTLLRIGKPIGNPFNCTDTPLSVSTGETADDCTFHFCFLESVVLYLKSTPGTISQNNPCYIQANRLR